MVFIHEYAHFMHENTQKYISRDPGGSVSNPCLGLITYRDRYPQKDHGWQD